jgi:hypothetical protein
MLVPIEEFFQVCMAKGVPINAQKDISMNFRQAMTQSACRSKALRLMGIDYGYWAELITKIILDLLTKVSGAKYDLFGALKNEPIEQVSQKGFSVNYGHGLGHPLQSRPQTRPQSTSQDGYGNLRNTAHSF